MKLRAPLVPLAQRGFALLVVLLALLALLVLCAPFLWTANKVDEAALSVEAAALARHHLDTAARHARHGLAATHPALDATPLCDTPEELTVSLEANGVLDPRDERGAMWQHRIEDVSARVDLGSASAHLVANLIGAHTFLLAPLSAAATEISVADASGFAEQGFLWIEGEIVRYGARDGRTFRDLQRGYLWRDGEGCGPAKASEHGLGAAVIAQEAWALPMWRLSQPAFREPGTAHARAIVEAGAYALSGGFTPEQTARLLAYGTFYGDVGTTGRWQRPVRLLADAEPGVDCTLAVAEARYFAPGGTALLREGTRTELVLIQRVLPGRIVLLDTVRQDWHGMRAEVLALASQPVNVNTAPTEVLLALVENASLANQNERVTRSEARELVKRIEEGRPWTGFGDLIERLVLPAAGLEMREDRRRGGVGESTTGFLSLDDAQALWRLFENGNDAELRFAGAPLSFVSRDTYELELRAAHNAPSGVQRAFAERHHVERIAPPGELLRIWATQAEFDEALRIGRDAPGWATGPNSTSVHDPLFGASPPPRRAASFPRPIEAAGEPPMALAPILPAEDGDAWVRPWVARVDEEGPRNGRVLHFDRSPGHPEGRLVAREPVMLSPDDPRVQWVAGDLARPLTWSAWFQSRGLPQSTRLFELSGGSVESDDVVLFAEDGDLVLRVLDGVGDHPATEFEEFAEVRFPLSGDGPGIPPQTWTHVEIDVRGNRPDQIAMRIDGLATPRTLGLTRLTAPLGSGESTILVESTEGFPERCVLRIGEELIEARRVSKTRFDATRVPTGPEAGFGGRIARERFTFQPSSAVNAALAVKSDAHPAGVTVQLHGYSTPLATNAPPGASQLALDLGAFAVARVIGVEGTSQQFGDEVYINFAVAGPASLGWGFESGKTGATGLRIGVADPQADPKDVLAAFSAGGGYAAILQRVTPFRALESGELSDKPVTVEGTPLFQVEIVRYSSRKDDVLTVAEWGLGPNSLPGLAVQNQTFALGGPRAFVVEWGGNIQDPQGLLADLSSRVLIAPISVPAGATSGFLAASAGQSQFAQLTHVDDAELTEWVRYDSIVNGHLVRDDALAIEQLYLAATFGIGLPVDLEDEENEGGGGGNGIEAPAGALFATMAPPPASAQVPLPYWQPDVGVAEDDDLPLTRAARTAFQFRGVLGTHSHAHPAGTPVLPVFAVRQGAAFDSTSGWPGRLDAAFVVDASIDDPGWPIVVHRAYRPTDYVVHAWDAGPALTSQFAQSVTAAEGRFDTSVIYVAAQGALQVPIAAGAVGANPDPRTTARLVMFPSGELPRRVTRLSIGSATSGALSLPGVMDEVVFGTTTFGGGFGFGTGGEGAALVLALDVGVSDPQLRVETLVFRHANGTMVSPVPVPAALPQDAGLLRIGDEIIAYTDVDSDGNVTVATDGRGMLGTEPQPHRRGEPVHVLEHVTVGELAAAVTADGSELLLESLADFPPAGTVLIGDELVHHTARWQGALAMPRASSVPGARDGKGAGLFRGRFGTVPSAHPAGTAVVHFPFRYWDRFAPLADAPELHYFGLSLDEPDAFVLRTFFEAEPSLSGAATIGVLVRTDPSVPWDTEPGPGRGLLRLSQADLRHGGVPLMAQTSRAEWRIFAEYAQGSFDAETGAAHGWKEAPQLELLGVEYLAPGRIYRVEEP